MWNKLENKIFRQLEKKEQAEIRARVEKIYQHENHAKPVTRRDFVARSLWASSGMILGPSVIQMLENRVMAQTVCPPMTSSGSSMMPFISVDLAGGASLAGEDIMVGGPQGQLDLFSNMTNYALPTNKTVPIFGSPDTQFGFAFHPESPFLRGLLSRVPAGAIPSIDMFNIAVASNDDTSANNFGVTYMLSTVGKIGSVVNSIGTQGSQSGGRHTPAIGSVHSGGAPTKVDNRNSARQVGGQGDIFTQLNPTRAEKVLQAISQLGSSKLRTFMNMNTSDQIKALVDCRLLDSVELPTLKTPDELFPLTIPMGDPLNTAFDNDPTGAVAAVSRLVQRGYAGYGAIELGGYDSHNGFDAEGGNTSRNIKFLAGQTVGRILQYFILNDTDVFIDVTSDGAMGVTRDPNSGALVLTTTPDVNGFTGYAGRPGDGGGYGWRIGIAYKRNSTRGSLINNPGRQIGHYTQNGVNQSALLTSNDPTKAAQAMIYNYLALHGMQNEITKVTGGTDPFREDPNYLIFKKPT